MIPEIQKLEYAGTHMHAHMHSRAHAIRIFFLNHFSVSFTLFWVSLHEYLNNNKKLINTKLPLWGSKIGSFSIFVYQSLFTWLQKITRFCSKFKKDPQNLKNIHWILSCQKNHLIFGLLRQVPLKKTHIPYNVSMKSNPGKICMFCETIIYIYIRV